MLYESFGLFSSTPMIYFGSSHPFEETDFCETLHFSSVEFDVLSPEASKQSTGLFFHWYDLA